MITSFSHTTNSLVDLLPPSAVGKNKTYRRIKKKTFVSDNEVHMSIKSVLNFKSYIKHLKQFKKKSYYRLNSYLD